MSYLKSRQIDIVDAAGMSKPERTHSARKPSRRHNQSYITTRRVHFDQPFARRFHLFGYYCTQIEQLGAQAGWRRVAGTASHALHHPVIVPPALS
jgi:hypothetical protein